MRRLSGMRTGVARHPDVCIPSPPPDLNCDGIPYRNFQVLPPDPHHFDGDLREGRQRTLRSAKGCQHPAVPSFSAPGVNLHSGETAPFDRTALSRPNVQSARFSGSLVSRDGITSGKRGRGRPDATTGAPPSGNRAAKRPGGTPRRQGRRGSNPSTSSFSEQLSQTGLPESRSTSWSLLVYWDSPAHIL